MIMPVTEARSENFPSIFGCVSPAMPRSRMKPRISPLSSFAHTSSTSAIGELVIQVFDPFSTKPPSTALRPRPHRGGIGAGIRLGQAKAADELAGAQLRQVFLPSAASDPKAWIGNITSDDCTENAER